MSAWWLLFIVPACVSIGVLVQSLVSTREYDRGYADGFEDAESVEQSRG